MQTIMAKRTPDYGSVLERIERALGRVALALEQRASPFKWYEASWYDQTYRRRVRQAVEAETAAEARQWIVNGGDGGGRLLEQFRLAPMRDEQCRFCCDANWHEDGVCCRRCGLSDKDGTERARKGEYYEYRR
jgi:hypothetical protein